LTAPTIDRPEEPVSLDLLAELIRDRALRREWRDEREPELGDLFDDALELFGGLRHASGWEIEVLLDELGCHRRTRDELEGLRAPDLHHCIGLLCWLDDMAVSTPDVAATRDVLREASRIYGKLVLEIGEGDSLVACQRATTAQLGKHVDDIQVTALDLIAIGEIGPAFQFASVHLPGSIGESARELAPASLDEEPLVHIRPTVMRALLHTRRRPHDQALSGERTLRLTNHLDRCRACSDEFSQQAWTLGHLDGQDPPPGSTAPLSPSSR
jgi:hypothetical protein